MNPHLPFAGLLAMCLVACATAPVTPGTGAGLRTVSVPLPLGETHTGGELLHQVMPVYPAAMWKACPAQQEIDAVVYVDANGTVSKVIGAVIDMALPPWETFFAAVRPALMQWRFEPLRVEHWAADAAGNAHAVDGEAQAFARRYAFTFTCHAGATEVTERAVGRATTH